MRDISIDIAKGVSIIAIVIGHIGFLWPQCSLLNTKDLFTYLWHVPVFFILAGFFLKDEHLVKPVAFFKKKFFSLYLKILYFYIPAVLFHNIFISWGWYDTNSVARYSGFDFFKQSIFSAMLAGREPILGAMWFVYVLFIALIGLSIISFVVNKFIKNDKDFQWIRFIVLLFFCIISGIASNKYGFTIKRFSNVFTAMFLIYIGKFLFQIARIDFKNGYLCFVCIVIIFEVACMLGGVSLNNNMYKDLLQPTIAGVAALYVILFIGKHIVNFSFGKYLAYLGRNSFYIMALHFVGFKLCSLLLIYLMGGGKSFRSNTCYW